MKRLMSTITRGMALAVAAAYALASTPLAAQAATVYIVDDDGSTACAPVYNGIMLNPLQSAIDDAITNGVKTILLCEGAFTGPFTVTGASKLTIKPKDPALSRPELRAPTTDTATIILVNNSASVTLDGLYVNGDPFANTAGGNMEGIVFENSGGTIQNNVIKNMADPVLGAASGYGIIARDLDLSNKASKVTIRNNLVTRYETVGILTFGAVKATITGNHLDGANGDVYSGVPLAGIAAMNFGTVIASASITKNTVYFNQTGIALGNIGKVPITGNVVEDSLNYSLTVETNCETLGQTASKNKVSGNTFVGPGIRIKAEAITGGCDPNAGMNTISANTFAAYELESPVAAVTIETVVTSGASTPHADKNKITGNTAWGFLQMVSVSGSPLPTGTVDSKNKVVHR